MPESRSPDGSAVPGGFDPARLAALTEQKRQLFDRLRASREHATTVADVEILRTGADDPVVFVHPVGGDLFCYSGLIRRMPASQPVVALGPDDLLRGTEAPTLADLAARYLERLGRGGVRPGVLAGWSFGGVVAYEMARQAAALGRAYPLVLIDSVTRPPQYDGMSPSGRQLLEMFVGDLLRSAGFDPAGLQLDDEVWDQPSSKAIPLIAESLKRNGVPLGLTAADLTARHRVHVNSTLALLGYDPQPYALPVHLLRAAARQGADPVPMWRQVVSGPLIVAEVPADHYGLLREPALAQVVSVIEEARARGPVSGPPSADTAGVTLEVRSAWQDSPAPDEARPDEEQQPAPQPSGAEAGGRGRYRVAYRLTGAFDADALRRILAARTDVAATLTAGGNGWVLSVETGAQGAAAALEPVVRDIARDYRGAQVPVGRAAYWRDRCAGLQAVSWPHDGVATGAGLDAAPVDCVDFTLGADVTDGIRRCAAEHWVGPEVVLAAALQVLLARVADDPGHEADVSIVMDEVTLRQRINPGETFTGLLRRAAGDILRDRANAIPLSALAEVGCAEPFRVALGVRAGDAECVRFGDAVGWPLDPYTVAGEADFGVAVILDAGQLRGRVDYSAQVFGRATAERLARTFAALLEGAVRRPGTRCGDLPLGVAPVVVPAASSAATSVVELFCAAAARYPDAVAVRWPGGQLSYRELRAHADALAARLGSARLAAVYGARSAELTVAVIATLLAGAGYVPLDPSYPAHRLNYMLADCRPDVLLCLGKDAGVLELPDGCRVVTIDDALSAGPGSAPVTPTVAGTSTCYVMYTSGSTGQPKGIVMPHSVPGNLIRFQASRSAATVGWNTLQFAPISFDVSVKEMFATWSTGGTLVLIDDETRRDPRELLSFLISQEVHRTFLPCVALRLLAETAASLDRYPTALREVCTGGEQLRIVPVLREFFRRTGASLDNHYGPTETHAATAELLPADPELWPALPAIGRAIDGAVVSVLDARMQPLPAGVPGEICIGGILADGYLGRRELTDERFKVTASGIRLYRTGDIGRMLDDGRLEWICRRDGQVKVRGFRVETGEIEVRLRAIAGIADAVVVAEPPDDPVRLHLVAYCVRQPGASETRPAAVLSALAAELPEFMVPARCVLLDKFPMTPNGKVDRLALRPSADADGPAVTGAGSWEPDPSLTEAEAVIARIYSELLGVARPMATTSFFELGGNSLGLARLATRLEEAFGPRVPVSELFTHNTIAGQAALMDRLFAAELDEYAQDDAMAVLDQMFAE